MTFPIGEYGLIGDTRTAALVAPEGSIDWLCLPRFDSPPLFGRLVGGDRAGSFSIGPAGAARPAGRQYRGNTATLETTWEVDGGRLVLTDAMISEVTGRLLPATLLVRQVQAFGTDVSVRLSFQPRFGYGLATAQVRTGRVGVVASRADMALAVTSTHGPVVADVPQVVTVRPGQPLIVAMSASYRGPAVFVSPPVAAVEVAGDEKRWERWVATLETPPKHRSAMLRSLLTLRLLTYSPSGAPVAAPTTSLPERMGGVRNWDYRYAWPRDASMGIAAFLAAGNDREALGFLAWLVHASRLERPRLAPLRTLHGRRAPRERPLNDWPGYGGSQPVRIGNQAGVQHQLDGYGWVIDGAWRLTRQGHGLDGETWRAMRAFADRVTGCWMLPDAGIWERRDEPRHHVHSKFMAWLALDRAIGIAASRGVTGQRIGKWREARRLVGEQVMSLGYDESVGSYTAAYGTGEADGALLLLPGIGLEPKDSPRLARTIDAIRSRLGAGGPLLYRYLEPDGLPGGEGAFLPCSFWLVQALAETGRGEEAEDLYEQLLGLAGPLGLFGEEMDPATHDHLGNFPQALTHASLLQAGQALADG